MKSKHVLRKGNIIFLMLPHKVKFIDSMYEITVNLSCVSLIEPCGDDKSIIHITGEVDPDGLTINMTYKDLQTIIRAAMEDDIQDHVPIISRSEILEIEENKD